MFLDPLIMLNNEQSFNPFLYHVNYPYPNGTRLVGLKCLPIVTRWLTVRIMEPEEVADACQCSCNSGHVHIVSHE